MSALAKITREAKRIRKAHPNKYKNLSNPWSSGYVVEAAKNVKRGKTTKPKKKAAPKRKVASKKKKAVKRSPAKRKVTTRSVVRSTTRSVGAVKPAAVGKKRSRRKSPRKVSGSSRGRSVGKKDKTMLYLGLGALALGAVYLFTKKSSTPVYYQGQNLPPLQQTGNTVRDQQQNNILQWAMAGGLAISAITNLIDRLNGSNDQEVESIYSTGIANNGDLGAWV